MRGDLLRVLQRFAILKINGDARRAEGVWAYRKLSAIVHDFLEQSCTVAESLRFNNRLIARIERRTPFDLKKHADVRAPEWKKSGQADRLDTGQGLDAHERFLEIGEAARRILRVFGEARSERERQYSLGIEALGNGQQAQEALDHESSADEQDQSQREFGDHQGR